MNIDLIKKWILDPSLGKIISAGIGFLVIVFVVKAMQNWVGSRVKSTELRYRAKKIIGFTGYLAAFIILSLIFSDHLSRFTVAFGVAGAGIAFALQEVIASVAGWIAVSFGSFYSPGDRIQLGGTKGDVIDIGVLRTTLMEVGQWVNADQYNGRIVRVANSFVFKEPVYNYSADFPFLWDEIVFPIRYGSDWVFAKETLVRVAEEVVGDYADKTKASWNVLSRKYLLEDTEISPVVTLRADQNWIEFTLRYIVDYRKRRITKDRLFCRLLEEVDKSPDRLRIATAGFEVLSVPKMDVNVKHQ